MSHYKNDSCSTMALDLLSLYFTIVLDILWIVFYKNFGFTVPRLLPELWIYCASCFTRTLDLLCLVFYQSFGFTVDLDLLCLWFTRTTYSHRSYQIYSSVLRSLINSSICSSLVLKLHISRTSLVASFQV